VAADTPFRKKVPEGKRGSFLNKLLGGLLLVAVIGGLIYSLFINNDPKVVLSSSVYRPEAVYRSAVLAQTGGLTYRTKFTYNEQAVINNLRQKFPEISSGSVELPIVGQSPIVSLTIAVPSYVYINSSRRYVLDADGVIISTNAVPAYKELLSLTDTSNIRVASGAKVLGSDAVHFINQIVSQCRSAHVLLSSLTLPAAAQELDVYTKDTPYFTKFYLGGDPLVQAGQFLAARHDFTANHIQPSQYLDVRVNGKVFYK